jgi:predicted nucleotidyltransferase
MKSLEEVKSQIENIRPTLQKRFNVNTIEIFGSYARNQASEKSDVDLLITYSTINYDHSTVYALKKYLRRKLGLKVDVISKEFLNPHIKDQVLKEAVPV